MVSAPAEQLDLLIAGRPDPLSDAVAWTQRNPDAWDLMLEWARGDVACGTQPSTRLYLCLLRRPHFATALGLRRMPGDPVLVNDHLSAALARLLKRYGIETPTRHAAVDSWKGAQRG